LEIARDLVACGANVRAFDPMVSACEETSGLEVVKDPYEASKNSDLVLLITEWPEFKDLNFPQIKKGMKKPVIVDCKNFLDPEAVKNAGFDYYGVGI
jgi:UDPglucose 6-dehydrogenase